MSAADIETLKAVAENMLVLFTAAMASFTAWLAFETRRLGKSSSENSTKQIEAWFKTSSDQIGVKTWLELGQRFDSEEMKRARKTLAQKLKTYSVNKHSKISETVLNFFEDVGTAYKMGYLNEKLSESSFGFYASRWWEVAKAYIDQERKRHGEDTSLFEDFKYFAEKMRLPGEVIDGEEIQTFLDDEMKLD